MDSPANVTIIFNTLTADVSGDCSRLVKLYINRSGSPKQFAEYARAYRMLINRVSNVVELPASSEMDRYNLIQDCIHDMLEHNIYI